MTRLLVKDIAAELGIKPKTWTGYVSRGKAPAPDGRFGREPWWRESTIEAWRAGRPRVKQ